MVRGYWIQTSVREKYMAAVEESILNSIKKNGYPEKKVSLPFQAIFKACKKNDVSLSSVLSKLEEQKVLNEISDDKILFFSEDFQAKPKENKAPEFSEKMVSEAMKKMEDMNPEELEKIKNQVMGMSPEEQKEMLKQAKNLFSQK